MGWESRFLATRMYMYTYVASPTVNAQYCTEHTLGVAQRENSK